MLLLKLYFDLRRKISAQESGRNIRGENREERLPLAYSNNILSFLYSNKK
jgi:hypothetical protein